MSDLVLGAVAYDPKVVTIWDGFRALFRARGLDLDYVLYSNYERQVDDLLDGRIDVAWNSPLAWVRARRLAADRGVDVRAVVMRDTDQDLRSVVVVAKDSDIADVADLRGKRVAVGAIDSPQATLLPLSTLRARGLDTDADVEVVRHDIGVGLHGDHIGGERDAAISLREGKVDAACMIDSNLLLFAQEGTLPSGSVRVLAETPPYDHCNMTVGPAAEESSTRTFTDVLLGMSYADAAVRPLLDLEGLKQWRAGRLDGYEPLESAVDEVGFYGRDGEIGAAGYRR